MAKVLGVLLFILIVFEGIGFSQTRATTEDGRAVMLQKDGSWQHANGAPAPTALDQDTYRKPDKATLGFRPNDKPIVLWVDPQIWKRNEAADNPPEAFAFINKSGDVIGAIGTSGFGMSMKAWISAFIEDQRRRASAFKVVYEKNRVVNGGKVLCLRIEETVEGMPIIMYGYLYTGKNGMVSLQTITPQNLYPKYESEMTDFLNGLVIND